METAAAFMPPKDHADASLFFYFVLSSSITYCLYVLFFHYSSIIWSFNSRLPVGDYTPWTRWCVSEKNGIQPYVLYILMLFNIGINVFLGNLLSGIKTSSVNKLLMPLFVLTSILFYDSIGIWIPMAEVGQGYGYACFMTSVLLALSGISVLILKYPKTINYVIAVLLIPVCFISTREIRFYDAAYVFSPALRILHGFKPSETYFQYDYLLSLFAAIWMKLCFSINAFKIPLQISYYVLLLGIFLFAQKLFYFKRYAVYLLISLILFRIYGNMDDPISMMQVTPLRLDLWFIVLVLVYFKGAENWLVGLSLGLLVVVHHNFGLIYATSYLSLVAVLFFLEAGEQGAGIKKLMRKCILQYGLNICMLPVSLTLYYCFFGSRMGNAAINFQQIGLGFMPITRNSFYWCIAAMLSLTFIVLVSNKKYLSYRNFQTGIFLVILAIGNSLYFFGRSHENNIINIAAVWLFCLFLLFDLMDARLQAKPKLKWKRNIFSAVSFIAVLLFAHCYSGRAVDRIVHQYNNLREGRLIQKDPVIDMGLIKKMTMYDEKVIFLGEADFYFYFLGRYIPQDYYASIYARVFKKETVDYLNSHLADGYYLVTHKLEYSRFGELIDMLKFKNRKDDFGIIVLSNNPIG